MLKNTGRLVSKDKRFNKEVFSRQALDKIIRVVETQVEDIPFYSLCESLWCLNIVSKPVPFSLQTKVLAKIKSGHRYYDP